MDSIVSTVTSYVQWLVSGEVPVDVLTDATKHKAAMEEQLTDVAEYDQATDDDIMASVGNPYHRSRGASPGIPGQALTECDYGVVLDSQGRLPVAERVVSDDLISRIHAAIPARWRLLTTWSLQYSTTTHGFSLNTLYHEMRRFDGACLLAVRAVDQPHRVFGAFCTEPIVPHQRHFGNGECFLFTSGCAGEDGVRFGATGRNDYYLMARPDFVAVGCGEGKFGLWLDQWLARGSTHRTPTFDNEPLVGGGGEFGVEAVEVWGLAHPRSPTLQ